MVKLNGQEVKLAKLPQMSEEDAERIRNGEAALIREYGSLKRAHEAHVQQLKDQAATWGNDRGRFLT